MVFCYESRILQQLEDVGGMTEHILRKLLRFAISYLRVVVV
jgi:hypothetical protein